MKSWQAIWRSPARQQSETVHSAPSSPQSSQDISTSPRPNGELLLFCIDEQSPSEGTSLTTDELNSALESLELPDGVKDFADLYLPSVDLVESTNQHAQLVRFSIPVMKFTGLDVINMLIDFPQSSVFGQSTSLKNSTENETPSLATLTQYPELSTASHRIRVGGSLRFWTEAAKLLLDLLSRGRFIPTLARQENRYSSSLRILLTESNDRLRFDLLRQSAPALCATALNGSTMADLEFGDLVLSFIQECGEALIRTFIKLDQFPHLDTKQCSGKHAAEYNWLRSLGGTSYEVKGAAFELMNLEQRLRRWSSKILGAADSVAPRTCFQLIAPHGRPNPVVESPGAKFSAPSEPWTLRIILQSLREPSQRMLAAKDFWSGKLGFLSNSEHTIEELETLLLRDLGRASLIFPPLNRALSDSFPGEVQLDTAEAYEFLRNRSPILEENGYGVIYPDWWRSGNQQIGLRLHVKPSGASASSTTTLGLKTLLDFNWEVSIDDATFSVEQFAELFSSSTPLVKINGSWLELEPTKLDATLKFIEKQRARKHLSAFDALRIGLGFHAEDGTLPIVSFTAEGWIEQMLEPNKGLFQLLAQPAAFHGTLRPYQCEGLSWLAFLTSAGVGGCLADDMGLGKTIQLLGLLLTERQSQNDTKPTLLVVPMSIMENWQRETVRFAEQLKLLLHHGPQRLSGSNFVDRAQESDLVITTYSLTNRDEAILNQVQWGRIALDEAQNIKNLATKQTQAIRRIAQHQLQTNPTFCHRLALTGTPLENRLDELWSIFDFLNPGYLGTISQFRKRFSVPIERYRDTTASDKLSLLVRPFILRRLKSDPRVMRELPEKIEIEEITQLTQEQAALYQRVLDEAMPQVDSLTGIHRKGTVLSMITRLKQVCDHPGLLPLASQGTHSSSAMPTLRSGKLLRLEEIMETALAEGDKALIFTQFVGMGTIIQETLADRFGQEVLFLHGGIPRSSRMKLIDRFQQDPKIQMFVLSLKVGGFGLNLTAANQVIHYDQWWNPAVEDQATDRAYRIGQTRNVQVRRLICQGTLEERIAALLAQKRSIADNIVRSTKNIITEMSTDELKNLLRLTATNTTEISDGLG